MTYRGRVQGGVIVLESTDQIPEGTLVSIETVSNRVPVETSEIDPAFLIGDLAVETGIPDLASNHDHYLYGHPKVEHERSPDLP